MTRLVPVHPILNTYLSAYLDAAGIRDQEDAFFFQSVVRQAAKGEQPATVVLTGQPIDRVRAFRMIKERAEASGIDSVVC